VRKLIVIQGPTASGKTKLAVQLAKALNTVVVSADSRQFYSEIQIGTAKPSAEEQEGVRHYFIDSHSIHSPVTSAQYEKEAILLLNELFNTVSYVILVGGSGMFIDALCNGINEIPKDDFIKEQLNSELQTKGLSYLLEELKIKDESYYKKVDKANPLRVLRALEVMRLAGTTFSSFLDKNLIVKRDFEILKFVIDLPREMLYERINLRVDQMIYNGLLEEVKSVFEYRSLQSLNTVGYKELFSYLNSEIEFKDAVELIKKNTRNYAKRQLTWFRKDAGAIWLKNIETDLQVDEVLTFIKRK
jgi:tRNA dimethylallyltransferase